MSRAVLLPFPGDPFLLHYWLGLFNGVWGREVDRLYVLLNSPIEPEVVAYIEDLCDRNGKIVYHYTNRQTDHGPAINLGLDLMTEDLVMLAEDDGFIFKPGMVDFCFRQIEGGQYDVVGSKRGSCATEILEAAQRKWGLAYEGEGDHGPNFWPCYLFLKADLLRATDRNFSAKAWYKGDVVKGLDYKVEAEVIYGDTLVNTSLQLRSMVPIERILCVPQYHGHPDDEKHHDEQKYLFDGKAPWTHIGSLSSGVGGILRDQFNRPLAVRMTAPAEPATVLPKQANSEMEKKEWERRVQWWLTFWEKREPDVLDDFAEAYRLAIGQIIDQYGLNFKNIRRRQKIYAELGL